MTFISWTVQFESQHPIFLHACDNCWYLQNSASAWLWTLELGEYSTLLYSLHYQYTNVAVAQMPLKVIAALGQQISELVQVSSATLLWLYSYTISVLELTWQ